MIYLLFLLDWLRKICPGSQHTNSVTTYTGPINKKQTSPILVLVINSLNKDLIISLQNQRRIESDYCEKIYRATRCLWLGSETDLSDKLRDNRAFIVQEYSEYDVYLIKIKLKEYDDGFKPNVDQIERIYAFRRLASLPVEISERLKVQVYENTGVYSC